MSYVASAQTLYSDLKILLTEKTNKSTCRRIASVAIKVTALAVAILAIKLAFTTFTAKSLISAMGAAISVYTSHDLMMIGSNLSDQANYPYLLDSENSIQIRETRFSQIFNISCLPYFMHQTWTFSIIEAFPIPDAD